MPAIKIVMASLLKAWHKNNRHMTTSDGFEGIKFSQVQQAFMWCAYSFNKTSPMVFSIDSEGSPANESTIDLFLAFQQTDFYKSIEGPIKPEIFMSPIKLAEQLPGDHLAPD